MFTRQFWLDLVERAVKTFAQALLGAIGGDAAISGVHLPWTAKLAAAGMAAGISALSSLVGTGVGAPDSGSWLPQNVDPPQPTAQPAQAEGDAAGFSVLEVIIVAVVVALVAVVVITAIS